MNWSRREATNLQRELTFCKHAAVIMDRALLHACLDEFTFMQRPGILGGFLAPAKVSLAAAWAAASYQARSKLLLSQSASRLVCASVPLIAPWGLHCT